jgi:hypothetical protein
MARHLDRAYPVERDGPLAIGDGVVDDQDDAGVLPVRERAQLRRPAARRAGGLDHHRRGI